MSKSLKSRIRDRFVPISSFIDEFGEITFIRYETKIQVRDHVGVYVWEQVWDHVWSHVWNQVFDAVTSDKE